MMGSTAPKVSRISSVLVTRVRWLLEHHPLDASCWSPPILARVAYPFYSVLLFIFFLHLTIQISPSFFGGVGSKRVNALSPCYIRRLQSFSSAGFPALQPHPTPSDLRSAAAQESWWRRVTWEAVPVIFLAWWVPYFPKVFLATHLSVVLVVPLARSG